MTPAPSESQVSVVVGGQAGCQFRGAPGLRGLPHASSSSSGESRDAAIHAHPHMQANHKTLPTSTTQTHTGMAEMGKTEVTGIPYLPVRE